MQEEGNRKALPGVPIICVNSFVHVVEFDRSVPGSNFEKSELLFSGCRARYLGRCFFSESANAFGAKLFAAETAND